MVKRLLYLEGFAFLILSICMYAFYDYSWIVFILLLLVPDLSMLGYLINQKTGAVIYNLFHTYSIPIVVVILGTLLSSSVALQLGLIWISHIGMDRMVGLGLKYQTGFKDNHLNQM